MLSRTRELIIFLIKVKIKRRSHLSNQFFGFLEPKLGKLFLSSNNRRRLVHAKIVLSRFAKCYTKFEIVINFKAGGAPLFRIVGKLLLSGKWVSASAEWRRLVYYLRHVHTLLLRAALIRGDVGKFYCYSYSSFLPPPSLHRSRAKEYIIRRSFA